jgi:hypothetical protein
VCFVRALSRSSGSICNGLTAIVGFYAEGAGGGSRCEPISSAADGGIESPLVFQADGCVSSGAIGARAVLMRTGEARVLRMLVLVTARCLWVTWVIVHCEVERGRARWARWWRAVLVASHQWAKANGTHVAVLSQMTRHYRS